MHLFKRGNNSPSTSSPRRSTSSPASPHRRIFSCREPQQQHPRLTRQRKLRHLSDIDLGNLALEHAAADPGSAKSTPVSRSGSNIGCARPSRSSSSPVLLPQPLPLPESGQLVFEFSSPGGRPLRSPGRAWCRADGDEANGAAASPDSSPLVEPIGEGFSSATVFGR